MRRARAPAAASNYACAGATVTPAPPATARAGDTKRSRAADAVPVTPIPAAARGPVTPGRGPAEPQPHDPGSWAQRTAWLEPRPPAGAGLVASHLVGSVPLSQPSVASAPPGAYSLRPVTYLRGTRGLSCLRGKDPCQLRASAAFGPGRPGPGRPALAARPCAWASAAGRSPSGTGGRCRLPP